MLTRPQTHDSKKEKDKEQKMYDKEHVTYTFLDYSLFFQEIVNI